MNEIIHSLVCPSCDARIVDILSGDDGYLHMRTEIKDVVPLVMRLAPHGTTYRFFCSKCATPTHRESGSRDFKEFAAEHTVESVITSRGGNQPSRFARIPMPTVTQPASLPQKVGECATAFTANVARVNEIAEGTLLTIGLNSSALALNAHIHGVFDQERSHFGRDLGDDMASQNLKEFASALQMLARLRQPLRDDLMDRMRANGEYVLDAWISRHPSLAAGVQAVLSSQVSLAWTAFEILAADLWVASVNARPKPLAANFANSTRPGGQDKNIGFTALAKYADHDFNLSGVMGESFVNEKKVDFKSLRTTKDAYAKAFADDMAFLDDPDLRLLELVRNLIVHRAGIVDQIFLDRLRDAGLASHPDCAGAAVLSPFDIAAPAVSPFAAASATIGTSLIQFVARHL